MSVVLCSDRGGETDGLSVLAHAGSDEVVVKAV